MSKLSLKGPVENKHLARVTFVFFIMFMVFFVKTQYTINLIIGMIMLQFSLAFKTWQLIREEYDGRNKTRTNKKTPSKKPAED